MYIFELNCDGDIYFVNPFSDLRSDSREREKKPGSDDILRWIRVLD